MDIHVFGHVFVSLCIPSMFMPFVLFHWGYLVASVYFFQFDIKCIETCTGTQCIRVYLSIYLHVSWKRWCAMQCACSLKASQLFNHHTMYNCAMHMENGSRKHTSFLYPESTLQEKRQNQSFTSFVSHSMQEPIRNHLVRFIMGRKNQFEIQMKIWRW